MVTVNWLPLALSLSVLRICVRSDELCGGIVHKHTGSCERSMVLRIPLDGSGAYHVRLNMTMPIYSRENIKAVLENKQAVLEGTTWEMIYAISHPSCNHNERVTRLVVNDRVLCANEPHTVSPRQPVTRYWYQSSYLGRRARWLRPTTVPQGKPTNTLASPENRLNGNRGDFTRKQFPPSGSTPRPSQDYIAYWDGRRSTAPTRSRPEEVGLAAICGLSPFALVQSGSDVQPGEFPWLGGLFAREGRRYLCTVNLVSQKHAITAAHCFATPENATAYGVLWGHPSSTRNAAFELVRNVRLHPAYDRSAMHDVAVMTLSRRVSFTLSLKPICLWGARQAGDARGIIAGFGPDYSNLRKIEYPIVSLETCRASNVFFHFATSEFTFCAGTRMQEMGPCKGDSGAGYMQWLDDRYYLRGLVSRSLGANGNCNLKEYVIFADLSKETDWVSNAIS